MLGIDSPAAHVQSSSFNGIAPPESMSTESFMAYFWGVRGCIPTPGTETARYGGNTACVELQVGQHRIIFDGGTGLHVLGNHLVKQMPLQAHIFFTHTHWDRIQGFPFFMPAFHEGNHFHIYGAVGLNGASIKQRLSEQMLRPNFPVPLHVMQSEMHFHNILPGSVIPIDDVTVETVSLNGTNSSLGFRVEWQGRSLVYATDTEHNGSKVDPKVLYLANGADVLIYDVDYADRAYYDPDVKAATRQTKTWKEAVEVAIAANVKRVILFHHDPHHEDEFLDEVQTEVQRIFPSAQLAREGMAVDVTAD
jgi:phosphoribosyl 1,2-cyclic phosphodiesterase